MINRLKFIKLYLKDGSLTEALKIAFDRQIEFRSVVYKELPDSVPKELSDNFRFSKNDWIDLNWKTEDSDILLDTFRYLKPTKPITCLLL